MKTILASLAPLSAAVLCIVPLWARPAHAAEPQAGLTAPRVFLLDPARLLDTNLLVG